MPVTRRFGRCRLVRCWIARGALGVCATLGSVVPVHAGHAQTSGLTLAEVVGLRRQGVSPQRILRSARDYCVSFALNDSARRELSAAGADSTLVGGLREVCRSAAPKQEAPSLLVDEDFTGANAVEELIWDDASCTMHPDPEGLRLESTGRSGACVVGYPTGALRGDVRIDLQVTGLGAASQNIALLGFALQPETRGQLSLSITADKRVELCRVEATHCERLFYADRVLAMRSGRQETNQIAVEVRGRAVTIFVNDQAVGQYQADQDLSGGIAFGVGPGTRLLFGHLRALALTPSAVHGPS